MYKIPSLLVASLQTGASKITKFLPAADQCRVRFVFLHVALNAMEGTNYDACKFNGLDLNFP